MGMTANGFPAQPLVGRPTAKTSPTSTNSLPRPSRQRESPFHRNRSKVFYESHSLPRFSTIFRGSRISPEDDKDLTSSSNNSSPEVRPSPSPRTPPPQIVLNSALNNDRDSNSSFRMGHFPFSISHKSQDSGFSDSGDSVSGGSNFSRTQSRVFYASDDSFKSSELQRRSGRRKLFNAEHLQDNSLSDSEKISYREEDDLISQPSIENSAKLSVSCVDGLGKKALNNTLAKKTMQVVKGHFLTRIGKLVPNPVHQSNNDIGSSSDEENGWQVEHKPLTPKTKSTTVVKIVKDEKSTNVKNVEHSSSYQVTKEKHEKTKPDPSSDNITMSADSKDGSLNRNSPLMNGSIRSSEKNNHVIKISVPAPPVQNVHYRTGTLERCRSPMLSSPSAIRSCVGVPSNISKTSALGLHLKETIQKLQLDTDEGVQRWMQDVRLMTENESMNTLHNKPIAKEFPDLLVVATRNTRDTIRALQNRSRLIASEFARLKRKLIKDRRNHLLTIVHRLRSQIRSLVNDYNNSLTASDINNVNRSRQEAVLAECDELTVAVERSSKSPEHQLAKDDLQRRFSAFADRFTALINAMLCREIKIIVEGIENPFNQYCLKTSIVNLAAVGLDGDDTCRLIAKVGGVRNLLSICLEHKYEELKDEALRALATVCCIPDAIAELEKVGGIECITEILCDSQSTEKVKSEAAGLIAQITSPLIDNNHHLQGLAENMASLIKALTGLAKRTKCDEVFLLATAALANITFLDSHACQCLCEADAPSILIKACREEKHTDSVFIKDQVATILANLVALNECRPKVVAPGGVVLLLCFLQVRPCLVHRVAEASACERVQQKSAIALSRLCSDSNIAQEVIKLQGIPRLVRLCKDEKERNQSDAVLVACLAALRKIATACGMDEFRDLNATELVEPRLLDSFLIYSSRQESYV